MTVLIPRDQILKVMERHNDCWDLRADPPAKVVRSLAAELATGSAEEQAEATALNDLVDQFEAQQ